MVFRRRGIPTRLCQIERCRSYIRTVAGRYAGRVHAWDVVNEIIDNDGSYRPTAWVKTIGSGEDLVKLAFTFAAEYAPDAELYYNDFNAWRPAKRDGIVRMVKMLQAEGIRIDGIGIQGHWGLNYPKTEYIEVAIEAYARWVKGDIRAWMSVLPLTGNGRSLSGDERSAVSIGRIQGVLDPYANGLPTPCSGSWLTAMRKFSDFYRKRDKIDRSHWGWHDGFGRTLPSSEQNNYPLLFDRNRQPKSAFEAVLNVPSQLQ